jgi:menaquinone-9 beta-reductase
MRTDSPFAVRPVNSYDLIVAGAGPAGCAAAIVARRHGARVLLLERGRFPRHKVCGEFVSAESLSLLEGLLTVQDRQLIAHAPRIRQGRIFADGAEIQAPIHPPAASISRFDMDCALWKACVESGMDTREEAAVQAVHGTGPFAVSIAGENVEAKAFINATGRWSNLTSATVRAAATGERWVGLKAHFQESHPPVSVDLYFFAGGYCGVQPVGRQSQASGVVNACAMVKATAATTLADVLRLHPALDERSRGWQTFTHPVSTSPLVFREPELVKDGILQVGDSATFVDPFIGDGISLALRSGALAGECLARFFAGECALEQAANRYTQQYRERLAHVFRNSSMLRRGLSWPRIIRRPVLALFERTPGLARRLVMMTR